MRMHGKIGKVLVANRGEIALRVIRTLRALGIRSVAIHSDADAGSLPVVEADEAVRIGPPPASESYLRADLIIGAALARGADAIHPGYGFLAESPELARDVEAAGLIFIGPTPSGMARLGNKLASRSALLAAGIPPIPGSGGAVSRAGLRSVAREMGLPLLLKAARGGGGKGIRIVRDARDLEASFDASVSEAASSFGSSEVIAERYLERARHVELQVLGDGAGGVRLFFERDCSIQRRCQKILEETPSPGVTPAIRERLLLAAGRAMSAERYRGAGTLEFLLSAEGEVFFLEMNTRIQVEHPITEVTAGIDIVEEQIAIAEGKRLPAWRDDPAGAAVEPTGAAIELRVNAEDPERDFLPSTGTVTALRFPSGPWLRLDTALEPGSIITPHYDSLLAKVIARGPDRRSAIARLEAALHGSHVGGIVTTLPLGLALLRDPGFLEGKAHCQYLAERLKDPGFFPGQLSGEDLRMAAAGAAWLHRAAAGGRPPPRAANGRISPWASAGHPAASLPAWRARAEERP